MTEGYHGVQLRDYQLAALEAIEQADGRGVRRQAIQMPTASGKTIVFAELLRRRGGRGLVLVHREELVAQAIGKIRTAWPEADLGIVKAERDEVDAQLVVASVQTLARQSRLARLEPTFDTVIVDEAHHAAAPTYRAVLRHVRAFEPDAPLVLGVSATLERGDRVRLDDVFEEIVFSKPLLELIADDYLCDARAKRITVRADFAALRVRAGDFVDSQAERMFLDAHGPEHIARSYIEHARDRVGIVFTAGVVLAHETAHAMRRQDIPAEALDGTTPADERRAILARLHSGETRVVANCAVLTEGFDEPRVDCIVVARPTRSQPLYVQMVGRGFRKHPEKTDLLILDVVGATARHDLVTLPTLFGVEPHALERRALTGALEEQRTREQQHYATGELVTEEVQPFARRRFAWVTVAPDHFVLAIDDGQLAIVRRDEGYAVAQRPREGPPRLIASVPSIELALGLAEDHVRRAGALHLVDRAAPWRSLQPTPKQLDVLRRLRIRPPSPLTRGTASDLISASVARFAS